MDETLVTPHCIYRSRRFKPVINERKVQFSTVSKRSTTVNLNFLVEKKNSAILLNNMKFG